MSVPLTWKLAFPGEEYPSEEAVDELLFSYLGGLMEEHEIRAEEDKRVRRAHNLFAAVTKDRNAKRLIDVSGDGWRYAHATLCWVLGHNKEGFVNLLGLAEAVLRGAHKDPTVIVEDDDGEA